jgi:hypothetical protein
VFGQRALAPTSTDWSTAVACVGDAYQRRCSAAWLSAAQLWSPAAATTAKKKAKNASAANVGLTPSISRGASS